MIKFNIGGVPEHFNYCIISLIEQQRLEHSQIQLIWKENPYGTGSLCKALNEKKIRVCDTRHRRSHI